MKERIVRVELIDLQKVLKKQGIMERDEYLNDLHIEPGELVIRVLSENKESEVK